MTSREQGRAMVLTRLLVGELMIDEAAALMGVGARQAWRLKASFERRGPDALIYLVVGSMMAPTCTGRPALRYPADDRWL